MSQSLSEAINILSNGISTNTNSIKNAVTIDNISTSGNYLVRSITTGSLPNPNEPIQPPPPLGSITSGNGIYNNSVKIFNDISPVPGSNPVEYPSVSGAYNTFQPERGITYKRVIVNILQLFCGDSSTTTVTITNNFPVPFTQPPYVNILNIGVPIGDVALPDRVNFSIGQSDGEYVSLTYTIPSTATNLTNSITGCVILEGF